MTSVVTLLLLLRGDGPDAEILLAMKKRGFGAGLWNGVGGKIEPNETLEQALIRECQEEIGVTPLQFDKVAVQTFKSPEETIDILMHTYVCRSWDGEPQESEEMAPRWFAVSNIPYSDMWQDDIYWLPAVLSGKKLTTSFTFDEDNTLLAAHIAVMQGSASPQTSGSPQSTESPQNTESSRPSSSASGAAVDIPAVMQ